MQRSRCPACSMRSMARLAQQSGFDAVYLSGAAFSAGALAMPDVGLFTLTELAAQTARLTRSVTIPVIVDADTGFGEAIHVERTVRELEAAGAAAIQIEDQRWPKRCGHLSGKTLIEPAEMCAKLRAAAAARQDPDSGADRPDRRPRRRPRSTTRSTGRRPIWRPGPIGFFPRRWPTGTSSSGSPTRSTRRWWPT